MDNEKAVKDPIFGALATELSTRYRGRDEFHELLLFLLYEKYIKRGNSTYWPYLNLLPSAAELDIPSLWYVQYQYT